MNFFCYVCASCASVYFTVAHYLQLVPNMIGHRAACNSKVTLFMQEK